MLLDDCLCIEHTSLYTVLHICMYIYIDICIHIILYIYIYDICIYAYVRIYVGLLEGKPGQPSSYDG